jgi:hypothetical protein
MFRMTDLAAGVFPAAMAPCHYLTRCHEPSVPCHLTGPPLEACLPPSYAPAEAGTMPGWCDAPTQIHQARPHGWGPQLPMAEMAQAQAQIPPYCESPTYLCWTHYSHHTPCAVWSCRVSAHFEQEMAAGGVAAQMGPLQQQMAAQLAAGGVQGPAAGQGRASPAIAEVDRIILELEAALHRLRAHRTSLLLSGG